MHALKEPISLVSRCRPPGSTPPRFRATQSSPGRSIFTTSKLSAFSTQTATLNGEEDDSIEIIGPIQIAVATSKSNLKAKGLALHNDFPGLISTSLNNSIIAMNSGNAGLTDSSKKQEAQNEKESDISPGKMPPTLPLYSYKDYSPVATVVYTNHEEEANDLVQTLNGPLGFDMEWRIVFRPKAPERRTALVQVSDKRMILLIHISSMKRFPQKLKEIIESKSVVKIGVNIHNDGKKLLRDFGILASNLVELGSLARHVDPNFEQSFGLNRSLVSLAKVVGVYCAKRLAKGKERTGNWEAKLGPKMIAYAANDAHCALVVYTRLMSLAAENKRTVHAADYTSAITFPNFSSTIVELPIPPHGTSAGHAMVRPQHIRAYKLWHRDNLPLQRICAKLRSEEEPLKESTVISYVIGALDSNPSLPFEMGRLKELVQMEVGSWSRHQECILRMERQGRGGSLTMLGT